MATWSKSGLRDRYAFKGPKAATEEDEESHILLSADHTTSINNSRGLFVRRLTPRGDPFSFQAFRERQQTVLNVISFVVFCSDPPFLMYGIIINFWLYELCRSHCWHCHTTNMAPKKALLTLSPIGITIIIVFAILSYTNEVNHPRRYSYDLSNVPKNHSFYHMVPVEDVSYSVKLLNAFTNISDYMQEKSLVTSMPQMPIAPLPVKDVKFFDNAIRFDLLLEFRQNPDFTSDFGCLIETDVVVDTAYVAGMMMSMTMTKSQNSEPPPDVLYIQHMWAHRKFEAQNVGLLCVRNKKNKNDRMNDDATAITTRRRSEFYLDSWLRLLSFLNNRRYCRLLPKGFLYWLAPNRKILYWDKDGGCTNLYPHCNYIHFTRPKAEGAAQALWRIDIANKQKKRLPGLRQKKKMVTMRTNTTN